VYIAPRSEKQADAHTHTHKHTHTPGGKDVVHDDEIDVAAVRHFPPVEPIESRQIRAWVLRHVLQGDNFMELGTACY
jgi:hypothetical protein